MLVIVDKLVSFYNFPVPLDWEVDFKRGKLVETVSSRRLLDLQIENCREITQNSNMRWTQMQFGASFAPLARNGVILKVVMW